MYRFMLGIAGSILGACLVPISDGTLKFGSPNSYRVVVEFGQSGDSSAQPTVNPTSEVVTPVGLSIVSPEPTPDPAIEPTPELAPVMESPELAEVIRQDRMVSLLQDKSDFEAASDKTKKSVPTFPSLQAEIDSNPLPEEPPTPMEKVPVVDKSSGSEDINEKHDRIADQMTIMVSALARNNLLNEQEAKSLAATALKSQDGKVAVSESGTVTVEKVASDVKPIPASEAWVYDSASNCCVPLSSYRGGGSTGNYAAAGGGSTGSYAGGGSTGSYAGGGSTGSYAPQSSTYSSVQYATAAPVYQSTSSGVRRGLFGRRTVTTSQASVAAASADCQWFQSTDGNWYQVCNR